jgi:hypothetical protein
MSASVLNDLVSLGSADMVACKSGCACLTVSLFEDLKHYLY